MTLRQVVVPQAEVLQRRSIRAGDSVGYGATWVALRDLDVGIVNIGYADGLARSLSNVGAVEWNGLTYPMAGRVSMDLIAFAIPQDEGPREGEWVSIAFDLPVVAAWADRSQYELLTGMGRRCERVWH